MTSDKDKGLVTKGAVKGILTTRIRGFEVSYADDRRITFDPRELFAAIDALEPAKPEDVTVILSKVHDIIDELGEMAPGKGVPNKISVRVLLGMLDKLDKYPCPEKDTSQTDVREKPEEKVL